MAQKRKREDLSFKLEDALHIFMKAQNGRDERLQLWVKLLDALVTQTHTFATDAERDQSTWKRAMRGKASASSCQVMSRMQRQWCTQLLGLRDVAEEMREFFQELYLHVRADEKKTKEELAVEREAGTLVRVKRRLKQYK